MGEKELRMIVSSPEEGDEEIRAYQSQNEESDADEEQEMMKAYDPYDIDEQEFGLFIVEKINDKTAQRLMLHLRSGSKNDKKDEDDDASEENDDVIKAHQCIHVML